MKAQQERHQGAMHVGPTEPRAPVKGMLWGDTSLSTGDSDLIDALSNSLKTVTFGHHEIHAGTSFVTDAVGTSMANADTLALAFKTASGATTRAHLTITFSTKAGCHVELIEAPTWDTSSGSQNAIYNRKREASMNSSGMLEDTAGSFSATDNVVLNPTTLAGGTSIRTMYLFGVSPGRPQMARETEEFPLKPDTQYAVRLTADGATNAGHLALNWYEHVDDN